MDEFTKEELDDGLERATAEASSFMSLDDAAEMFRDPMDSMEESDIDVLKRYSLLKQRIKKMKAELDAAETERDELRSDALAIMDAKGIGKIEVEGRTLAPASRTWYYVKAAEKHNAHQWLHNNGFEALVKPTVNVISLSSQLKEYADQGHDIPTDLFDKSIKRDLRATK